MRPRTSFIAAFALGSLVCGPAQAEACLAGYPHFTLPKIDVSANAPYLTSDGLIRIVGYNDMAEMLESMASLLTQRDPRLRFDLLLKGTRTGPPALIDGTSLFAPMGAEWEGVYPANFRARYGNDPVMIRVAHDSLNPVAISSPTGIVVHRSNPLARLSMAQLKAIFTGNATIRDWSQLDDKFRGAIHPVGLGDSTAIGQFVRAKLDNARFAASFTGKPQSRAVITAVAADPQAIGFANLNQANPQVRVVGISRGEKGPVMSGTRADILSGRYALDRHLLVYARREATGKVERLARIWLNLMLSCEGQAIIAQGRLGYIPLNPQEASRERHKLN